MKIKERRIWAFVIDVGFVSCISGLVQVIIPTVIQSFGIEVNTLQIVISISLSALFYFVYYISFDLWNDGVSIGKSALGLQVRLQNKGVLTTEQRLIRTILKTLSIIFIPVSLMMFLYNSFTLQDYFMKTRTSLESI